MGTKIVRLFIPLFCLFCLSSLSFAEVRKNGKDSVSKLRCFQADYGLPSSKAAWLELKGKKFELNKPITLPMLLQLKTCLAEPDPKLRDGVAYNAFSTWLRADKVNVKVVSQFFDVALNDLHNSTNDPHGVYQPFLILVLSEVVRVDRISPYLDMQQRERLSKQIESLLKSTSDYRGFEEGIGWRHQIAHLSDVVLQMALNKNFTAKQLQAIYSGIHYQLRQSDHAFVFNEAERLSRAVLYGLLNKSISTEYWQSWFSSLLNAEPYNNWQRIYNDKDMLVIRHNVRQFLAPIVVTFAQSKSSKLDALRSLISEAWKATS